MNNNKLELIVAAATSSDRGIFNLGEFDTFEEAAKVNEDWLKDQFYCDWYWSEVRQNGKVISQRATVGSSVAGVGDAPTGGFYYWNSTLPIN